MLPSAIVCIPVKMQINPITPKKKNLLIINYLKIKNNISNCFTLFFFYFDFIYLFKSLKYIKFKL